MSAEASHAPVTYLEPVRELSPSLPDPRDQALTELALALDTQRSANKAVVGAIKDMDRMLGEQRELTGQLEERNQHLEAQLLEYSAAVTEQVSENKRLWCEVRLAEHRLSEELDKSTWRRLLRR